MESAERRNERRAAIRIRAFLQLQGRSPVMCEVINISLNGALVKPRGHPVRLGEQVSLVLAFSRTTVVRTFYRKADVVHISQEGVGLKIHRQTSLPLSDDDIGYSTAGNHQYH